MRAGVDLDKLVHLDAHAARRRDATAHQIVLDAPLDRDRREVRGPVRHDAAVVPERDLLRPPGVEHSGPDHLRDLLARAAAVRERARHEAAGQAVVLQIAEHLRHRVSDVGGGERRPQRPEPFVVRGGGALAVELEPLLFCVDPARFEEEPPQLEAPFRSLLARLAHEGGALVHEPQRPSNRG